MSGIDGRITTGTTATSKHSINAVFDFGNNETNTATNSFNADWVSSSTVLKASKLGKETDNHSLTEILITDISFLCHSSENQNFLVSGYCNEGTSGRYNIIIEEV